ncbi:hypothetical protein TNCV_217751 [Trichonephila clavipes]|nr:hypothetical protein TNCV_217751 [Trichonephila clavipes]
MSQDRHAGNMPVFSAASDRRPLIYSTTFRITVLDSSIPYSANSHWILDNPPRPPSLEVLGMTSSSVTLKWKKDTADTSPANVLKPPSCLHNGSQVYDCMGLDEWNSWFKSQVRDSNRSQDIVDLKKF